MIQFQIICGWEDRADFMKPLSEFDQSPRHTMRLLFLKDRDMELRFGKVGVEKEVLRSNTKIKRLSRRLDGEATRQLNIDPHN